MAEVNMTGTAQAEGLDVPFVPQIALDRDSEVPLYQQIAHPLEELILAGRLEPGRLIEDEVSMARRLKVSRPTTRRALRDLVARGLLTRRRGVGTRVTPMHVRRPLGLTSLNDDLVDAGFTPRTEVLSYEVMLAGEQEAREAMNIYLHRLVKYVGAYTAVMGGLDALTFTAGIGENDANLRRELGERLGFMGMEIDPELNAVRSDEPRVISTPDSRVTVLVVPTNEELAIARQSLTLI